MIAILFEEVFLTIATAVLAVYVALCIMCFLVIAFHLVEFVIVERQARRDSAPKISRFQK
jgi:type IV secretory pathway VirB3-like protein